MPKVTIRPQYSFAPLAWPTLCPRPDVVPDVRGRLPSMSYKFKNIHSKQPFEVELFSRIGPGGVTHVEKFEMRMT